MFHDRENEIISTVTFIHHRLDFRDPPFSFMGFCEAFPSYELLPAPLPKGLDGEIIIKGAHRIIRYQAASKPPKNRFTIAHEIGHGFLHEEMEFSCQASRPFSMFSKKQPDDREWEADYFASELIMPIPCLNRLTGDLEDMDQDGLAREIKRLADIFGVGKAVMRGRIEDLRRLRVCEEDLASVA